ncbi:MAG: alpha/beta hydrolase [Actinomycetota bacterium]|nr:alpha/beta hydrolase [Actinomycetota bacterium]
MFTSRAIEVPGASLATRDYGGGGPALVLMHGAGMDQGSLEPLSRRLRESFRVVTFDFRGHGRTSQAPWTLASAVSDLTTVTAGYGLAAPAVGGHSLGGMVAVAYGADYPTCPGVINIDGHGRGRVDQYVGYDEAAVRHLWEQQDRRIEQLTEGFRAVLIRALLFALRKPAISSAVTRQVVRESGAIDLFTLYEKVTCPLLVFNATASDTSRLRRMWAGEGVLLAAAYRQGLVRDLAALEARRGSREVATVEASHMLIRTHPELVAHRITSFLRS